MTRNLKIAWGLLYLALIVICVVQGLRFLTRDMIDFTVVHRTGVRVFHGEPIYDFADKIMLFKYAPILSYLLAPLALLPKLPSAYVFFLLSVAAFAACFQLVYRWVIPDDAGAWARFLIVALTLLSTLRVIMNSLDFGQVQVFILLGMLTCTGAFTAKKWLRGGFVLSLLALAKIVPAVLSISWLSRKQWRPAVATGIFSVVLLALPTLWLGPARAWDLLVQWWQLLQISTNQTMIDRWTNQSLLSALTRILSPNHYNVNWLDWSLRDVIILTDVILALWLMLIVWMGYRRDQSRFPSARFAEALDLSYYLLFIILAFPLAWRYHFTSMILPNMLILSYLFCYAKRDYVVSVLFAASLILSSLVNQEILGSRLFEWFHLHSCLTISVFLTTAALIRLERRFAISA